jgi:branched-subunit amino acid transport protein
MSEVMMLMGAIAGTYLWRALGVAFSARVEPDGALFRWVTCVSYAMLAALISRMTVLPLGSLAETPMSFRPGVIAGVGTFIALVAFA